MTNGVRAVSGNKETVARTAAGVALRLRRRGAAIAALAPFAGTSTDPRTLLLLARTYLSAGRVDDALDLTRRVAGHDPDCAEATVLLARLLRRAGERDEAVATLGALIGRPGVPAGALGEAAGALASWNQHARVAELLAALPDEARAAVTDAVPPRYRDAVLATAAAVALDRAQHAEALAAFERITDLGGLARGVLPVAALRREADRLRTAGDRWTAETFADLAHGTRREHDATRMLLRGRDPLAVLADGGFPWPVQTPDEDYTPEPGRVLYLTHTSLPYSGSGYAVRTHALLRALRQRGRAIDGVTRLGFPSEHEAPAAEVVDEVPYRRLAAPLPRELPMFDYVHRYAEQLERLARAERPALLHAAGNHWNGVAAGLVARRLGIPYVYEVRGLGELARAAGEPGYAGTDHYRVCARLEADAAAAADRVVTTTEALRDELVRRGVPRDHITVVGNGADTTRLTPRPRDTELAAELGLTGRTVIGHLGPAVEQDGLELLLDAAATLRAERDDFTVLVAGPVYPELAARAEALGGLVVLTGEVGDGELLRYRSLVDIAAFPRLPRPGTELVAPLGPFEAMAMGQPVVVSDVPALTEVVTDGVRGLVHARGDAAALTTALRTLLGDPGLRRRLGAAGRKWVEAERDWGRLAARVDDVHAEITARGAR